MHVTELMLYQMIFKAERKSKTKKITIEALRVLADKLYELGKAHRSGRGLTRVKRTPLIDKAIKRHVKRPVDIQPEEGMFVIRYAYNLGKDGTLEERRRALQEIAAWQNRRNGALEAVR